MPNIRPYRPEDLPAVQDICVRTGDAGGDARGQYSSDELMGDCFAAPYVTLEPQFAFVLEDAGQPVGYVLGTADTPAFVRSYATSWVPHLRRRYPEPYAETDRWLLELGLNPQRMLEPGLENHPAHLHIDLLPQVQGQGFGRQLIHRFLGAVREAGASAVHLGMAPTNTSARLFYERLGFQELPVGGPTVTYLGRSTTG
ncbi:GNAT family N-acetyltransferase [Kineosporia rhizophila]|uniref:GNAT family N-acetyltransferase n=1 Tax=Kineosporia rhizophila TaxID=84633 RepID=UPI000AB549B2|nr:GNAT family N-acetyltransferase [Kineosporia rhizophila]